MSYGLPRLSVAPVLWLPLWLGTLRDASEYGNHGSPVAPLYWTARSGVDGVWSNGASYVSVAHSASIGSGGRGSLVMGGRLGDHFTWKNFFRKVTGGSRLQFYCSSALHIELFDGTNHSNLAVDITNARSVAVTWPDTGKPSFYVDGVFAGLGSVAVAVPPTADILMIGGDSITGSRAHIASALQYNEVLSASEIAELDDYLVSRITPRKQWPGASPPLRTGLVYRDNIQSARVTLVTETSGKLSNTGLRIITGSFELREDGTGRHAYCVAAGALRVRLLGADGFTTKLFTEEGGATISKDATGFDLDFGTGDIVRAVQLANT